MTLIVIFALAVSALVVVVRHQKTVYTMLHKALLIQWAHVRSLVLFTLLIKACALSAWVQRVRSTVRVFRNRSIQSLVYLALNSKTQITSKLRPNLIYTHLLPTCKIRLHQIQQTYRILVGKLRRTSNVCNEVVDVLYKVVLLFIASIILSGFFTRKYSTEIRDYHFMTVECGWVDPNDPMVEPWIYSYRDTKSFGDALIDYLLFPEDGIVEGISIGENQITVTTKEGQEYTYEILQPIIAATHE